MRYHIPNTKYLEKYQTDQFTRTKTSARWEIARRGRKTVPSPRTVMTQLNQSHRRTPGSRAANFIRPFPLWQNSELNSERKRYAVMKALAKTVEMFQDFLNDIDIQESGRNVNTNSSLNQLDHVVPYLGLQRCCGEAPVTRDLWGTAVAEVRLGISPLLLKWPDCHEKPDFTPSHDPALFFLPSPCSDSLRVHSIPVERLPLSFSLSGSSSCCWKTQ